MFNTDRVFLDYYLSKDKAMKRYKNWLTDDFGKSSCLLYKLVFKDKFIGFFYLKDIGESMVDSVLAGIFSQYKKLGLGSSIVGKHIELAKNLGYEKIITKVSSNNIESLRIHLAYGYEIKDSKYVYRKLNGGN